MAFVWASDVDGGYPDDRDRGQDVLFHEPGHCLQSD